MNNFVVVLKNMLFRTNHPFMWIKESLSMTLPNFHTKLTTAEFHQKPRLNTSFSFRNTSRLTSISLTLRLQPKHFYYHFMIPFCAQWQNKIQYIVCALMSEWNLNPSEPGLHKHRDFMCKYSRISLLFFWVNE